MADEQLELRMDPSSLYREETFTDRRIGVIRMMTPVKTDGAIDLGRQILYVGEAQLLSPVGALPITFEIEATSLGDAAEKFAAGAKVAVERAIRELQDLRREQSSNIVIPDRMPPDLGGGGEPAASGRPVRDRQWSALPRARLGRRGPHPAASAPRLHRARARLGHP